MFVIYELKVREGELLLQQLCQLILYRLSPLSNEHDELVDGPSNATTGNLSVIAFELGLYMLRLRPEVFLCPHRPMQLRIVDEGLAFFRSILYHLWCQLLLTHPKQRMVLRIVPKDSHTRHLLDEETHILHLCLMVFI